MMDESGSASGIGGGMAKEQYQYQLTEAQLQEPAKINELLQKCEERLSELRPLLAEYAELTKVSKALRVRLISSYSGFSLLLGKLYNAGWENEEITPKGQHPCENCRGPNVTRYRVRKEFFNPLVGTNITKFIHCYCCQDCFHERAEKALSDASKTRKAQIERTRWGQAKVTAWLKSLTKNELEVILKETEKRK
jgi:hypothetical protein